jgi:hypothetical protein
MVKKNLHPVDRNLRVLVSLVLIYFGFIETGWIMSQVMPWLMGIFGIINFVGATLGFCPFYAVVHIDTSNSHEEDL